LAIGRTLRHVAQPELTAALQAAAQVDVGDGAWKFARRKSSADITPLYAVVAAAWATSQGTNYNVLDSFY
jgi:hypothetical protein